ncbi:MAG: phosphatidylglycerophosphatase A, partial [Terracidiphilus sp.]
MKTERQSSSSPAEKLRPKQWWAWIVATFFGAGMGKPGPGTWGSVAAVLLWAAYAWAFHPSPQALL